MVRISPSRFPDFTLTSLSGICLPSDIRDLDPSINGKSFGPVHPEFMPFKPGSVYRVRNLLITHPWPLPKGWGMEPNIMCARYSIGFTEKQVRDLFNLDPEEPAVLRYNVAPTQDVPAVVEGVGDHKRDLETF